MKPAGSASDALVVSTEQLSRVLMQFVNEIDSYADKANYMESDRLSGLQILVERSGLQYRAVGRILHNETKFTNFQNADALLTASGQAYRLHSGEITVVPNPQWSLERWVKHMADAGCEPEDVV